MKRIILSFFALLLIGSSAKGAEGFSVKNVSLPINGQAELQVAYNLDDRTCRGIEFDIVLPNKLEFVSKSQNVIFAQGFENNGQTFTVSKMQDGSLKVLWAATSNIPIPRKEGIIIAVKVQVKAGETVNTNDVLVGSLKNGVIGANEISDFNFNVTITKSNPDNYVVLDENSLFDPEETDDDVDILVKRTITPDKWSTLCLPFTIKNAKFKEIFGSDVELATFDSFSDDQETESIFINFSSVDLSSEDFEENTPYLIKTSKDITSFQVNATIEPDDVKEGRSAKGFFYGTYKACTKVPENYLFINDNNVYYSSGLTMIKGFRGYFYYKNQIPKNAASRTTFLVDGKSIDDGTTKICPTKYFSETGKVYSISGRYMGENVDMKSLPKGIYIVDGVKIVNE